MLSSILQAGLSPGIVEPSEAFANAEAIIIEVIDEGVGMSPEVFEQAMEPYFKTRSKTGGSGLGLAMVYSFVRQSAVKSQSRLDQGKAHAWSFVFLPSKSDVARSRLNTSES